MKATLAAALLTLAALTTAPARADDLPDVVERVHPSTVHVLLMPPPAPAGAASAARPGTAGEEMDEFFARFMRQGGVGTTPRSGPSATGSGFVVSADGYIVTADFAIDGPGSVDVVFPDRRRFRATVVGRDRASSVAVLRIDATGLTPLRFGDSSRLRLGERVFAIGAPYNLPGTVTDGIVSTLERDQPELGPTAFIQTTVQINPGSGGGPLLNLRGEVVGMNSHIYTRSASFSGLSFAIPADLVRRVYEELRRNGKVTRARIAINVADPVADTAGRVDGVRVQDARPGGPAAVAGIRANDVVVRYGGIAVTGPGHLTRLVQWSRPGERVEVGLLRDGRPLTVTIVPEEQN